MVAEVVWDEVTVVVCDEVTVVVAEVVGVERWQLTKVSSCFDVIAAASTAACSSQSVNDAV